MPPFGPEENPADHSLQGVDQDASIITEHEASQEEVVRLIGITKAAGILGVSNWQATKILTPTPESDPMPPNPVLYFPTGRQWAKRDIENFRQATLELRHTERMRTYEAKAIYRFEDITDRKDIILREHFEDLALLESHSFKNAWIRVFHKIVDGGASSTERLTEYRVEKDTLKRFFQVREPKPLYGAVIIHRSSADIPPYDGSPNSDASARVYAEYGIQAGSILEGLRHLIGQEPGAKANQTTRGLHKLAEYLDIQINQSSDASQRSL